MNWAEVSVVHYADAQLREFLKDLLEAIPRTRTVGEAEEIVEIAGATGLALLRIQTLARGRMERLNNERKW